MKYEDKRAELRFKVRRKVLPGYPIETPFKNIDEVKEYLSGSSITCLLCGKTFKSLIEHIKKIHEITLDEYREKYNIPWTYALICEDLSNKLSEMLNKRVEEGYVIPLTDDDHLKNMRKNRRVCPFAKEVISKHSYNWKGRKQTSEHIAKRIKSRINNKKG